MLTIVQCSLVASVLSIGFVNDPPTRRQTCSPRVMFDERSLEGDAPALRFRTPDYTFFSAPLPALPRPGVVNTPLIDMPQIVNPRQSFPIAFNVTNRQNVAKTVYYDIHCRGQDIYGTGRVTLAESSGELFLQPGEVRQVVIEVPPDRVRSPMTSISAEVCVSHDGDNDDEDTYCDQASAWVQGFRTKLEVSPTLARMKGFVELRASIVNGAPYPLHNAKWVLELTTGLMFEGGVTEREIALPTVSAGATAEVVIPLRAVWSGETPITASFVSDEFEPSHQTARVSISGCAGDFDGNGQLEVPDIFAFLTSWFATSGQCVWGLAADINGDGCVTSGDMFEFLQDWFVTCN